MIKRIKAYASFPHLYCHQCYSLYNDEQAGIEPACKTESGCPIGEDLAADPVINERALGFIKAKMLYKVNSSERMYVERLKELDLYEPDGGLIELELAFREYEAANAPIKGPEVAAVGNRKRA